MKTRIVKIGNSQGIRIPKIFLQQSGMTDEVEIEIRDSQIVISPLNQPRALWEQAFREMANLNHDTLIEGGITGQTVWDNEEWIW
jgi:antitoxin MazE